MVFLTLSTSLILTKIPQQRPLFNPYFSRYAMDHCENERKKPGAARLYSKPPSSMTINVQFLMYIFRRIRIGGKIKTRKNHAFELE